MICNQNFYSVVPRGTDERRTFDPQKQLLGDWSFCGKKLLCVNLMRQNKFSLNKLMANEGILKVFC